MPSTVVHCALAVLVAAGLLGAGFDRRAALVVVGVAIVPDLDAFIGLVVTGAHRAALHTLFVPLAAAVLVYYDSRVRERSWLRSRWGAYGVHLAWAAIAAYAVGGIGLDLVTRGVNVFWPVHDQFYLFSGKLELSNQQGLVQTFVEFPDPPADGSTGGGGVDAGQFGSTEEVQITSGVDPSPGDPGVEPAAVERVFPVVQSGWELLLVVSALLVLARTELRERFGRDA